MWDPNVEINSYAQEQHLLREQPQILIILALRILKPSVIINVFFHLHTIDNGINRDGKIKKHGQNKKDQHNDHFAVNRDGTTFTFG